MKKRVLLSLIIFMITLTAGCSNSQVQKENSAKTTTTADNEKKGTDALYLKTGIAFIDELIDLKKEKRAAYVKENLSSFLEKNEFPIVKGNSVLFVYAGDKKSIGITGDCVGGWPGYGNQAMPMDRIEGTDIFYKSMDYEKDARLEYKLIVDGKMVNDPLNKKIVPNEFTNNEFSMPGYKFMEEQKYYDDIPHGKIENKSMKCSYYSDSGKLIENASRTYSVYLPAGYTAEKKYRVIYFQDGRSYLADGRMANILDFMIAKEEIEPVVGVFINYIGDGRAADYVKPTKKQYADFFVNEFITMIEKEYSVRSDADGRCLVGESNSGSFIVYLATEYPDSFGYLLSNSGAYNTGMGAGYMNGIENKRMPVKLFMISGQYEFWTTYNKILYDSLKKNTTLKGLKYKRYNMTHNFALWRDTIRDGLLWLFYDKKIEEAAAKPVSNNKLIRISMGWERKNRPANTEGKKCYIYIVKKKDEGTLKETVESRQSEGVITGIGITPFVTQKVMLRIKVDKPMNYGILMFYDVNGNGKFEYNTDYYVKTNEGIINNLVVDEEDYEIPHFMVGH